MTMNQHETSALQHVLGHCDGHLEPRPLEDSSFQADWQEQTHFASGGGLAVPSMGDDAAGRKAWSRAVDGLERHGSVIRCAKELRLTEQGHATARRLAGLPTVQESDDLLNALATCPARWGGHWVSEPSLCGLSPCPSAKVGGCRIPPERLGYLLAHSDALLLEGLIAWRPFRLGWDFCLYRLTEEGQRRATAGDAANWFKRVESAKTFPLSEPYVLAFDAAYRARETARPRWPNRINHLDPVDPPKA